MILNRRSPDVFRDIAQNTAITHPHFIAKPFSNPPDKAIELAIKLFEEEGIKEYLPALNKYFATPTKENLIEAIDGAMDTIVVVSWFLAILNIPGQAFWNEVQRSNQDKFRTGDTPPKPLDLPEYRDIDVEVVKSLDRWVIKNAKTGKYLKPEGWTKPNLFEVMQQLETIYKMRTMPDAIATTFMKDYFHSMETKIEKGEISG